MPQGAFVDGIRVWEWPGDPPDTLLLHGIGNYGRYWDDFADAVRGRLHLVAPDARGHGESPKPDTGYTPDDFVRDALAVMDGTGLARPLVVGHSMGGFHAVALTLAHPERVGALVLVDVGPRVKSEGSGRARRLSLERPDRFPDDAAALVYLRETSPGYSDGIYANRMRWLFDRGTAGLTWRSRKDALARILDARGAGGSAWERLEEIACPVLIVRGTRSQTLDEDTAREMAGTLPDARMVELDARHNVPLDRPRELADAVVGFAKGSY